MKQYLIMVLTCISLRTNSVKHFVMFVGHLYILFREKSVKKFHPFKKFGLFDLSCKSSLHILDTSPLSDK